MAHYFGKFLELNGLLILGAGLVWGIRQRDLGTEMQMLALGAGVFLAGYFLERRRAGGG